jgi:hypothetical protein
VVADLRGFRGILRAVYPVFWRDLAIRSARGVDELFDNFCRTRKERALGALEPIEVLEALEVDVLKFISELL